MGYKNINHLLPVDLIQQIQKYIDGETIYIPRTECNRKKWGENSDVYYTLNLRNKEIYNKYRSGVPVRQLAEEYHISPQGIYKVLSKFKT